MTPDGRLTREDFDEAVFDAALLLDQIADGHANGELLSRYRRTLSSLMLFVSPESLAKYLEVMLSVLIESGEDQGIITRSEAFELLVSRTSRRCIRQIGAERN